VGGSDLIEGNPLGGVGEVVGLAHERGEILALISDAYVERINEEYNWIFTLTTIDAAEIDSDFGEGMDLQGYKTGIIDRLDITADKDNLGRLAKAIARAYTDGTAHTVFLTPEEEIIHIRIKSR
jgi:hypothetical protein